MINKIKEKIERLEIESLSIDELTDLVKILWMLNEVEKKQELFNYYDWLEEGD